MGEPVPRDDPVPPRLRLARDARRALRGPQPGQGVLTGSGDTVLVTGGTGYVATWCLAALLERGFAVRATVRDTAREGDIRAALAVAGADPAERLSVVAADLTADAGWAEAVDGCRYVLHVASPLPRAQPKNADELIVPARDGALRVLRASLDAGVERVVLTSSVAAIRGAREGRPARPLTEEDWSDGADTRVTPYVRSKTIAERAAWQLARDAGAEQRLAVVNPAVIIGPVTSRDVSSSIQVVERLLAGRVPAIPRLGFAYVDVRDVADLHLRAMTTPEAGGERFIASDRFLWTREVAEILRDRLGDEARRVPTRMAPDIIVKLKSLFDAPLRAYAGDLGVRTEYASDKARTRLGWTTRPIEDAIADTGRSLLDVGIVRAP